MHPIAASARPPPALNRGATVFVNGKFLAQRTTGVQRVALALLTAIDADPSLPAERFVVLAPPQAREPGLRRIAWRRVGAAKLPLHLWEQALLPWAARGGLLLSLAGSAPWFSGRCAAMLHDAALWDVPEAYTAGFQIWYRALFQRLAGRADPLFTVSAFSGRRLSQVLGRGHITVLRNGADHLDGVEPRPQVLQRLGLHGRRYLLTVGSRSPAKNLPLLAAAYARSGLGPGVPLICVGGASAGVFASAPPQDTPPGWTDVGVVDDGELKALYGAALALLVPSRHEGFCLPAAEALHAGCAVVASRAAALPELFGDDVAAWPVDDAAAWAPALRRLVDDEAWRTALVASGRRSLGDARWAGTARQLVAAVLPGAA
jgi:glycosyltransferase involved in cell wall biosynthesis